MEKDDIFKFGDFINGNKIDDLMKMKSNLLKEGLLSDEDYVVSDDYEEINQHFNPYKEVDTSDESINNTIESYENTSNLEDEYNEKHDDYYELFKDKAEDFICDISVEGVNQNDTEVRLIIESTDWNLIFNGSIKNGKCIIPIRKLNILNEGQTGKIKLEVNADGNLFTPWEDKFIVKVDKKVKVSLNENVKYKKQVVKMEPGVKVNVNKKRL